MAQLDGGSNSHVFTDRSHFIQYRKRQIQITQISGTKVNSIGYGMVLIRIGELIITLWPAYHMPNNPQNTISQPALKFYNKFRSVRTEALDWIKLTDQQGKTTRISTLKQFQHRQKLDYIDIDIYKQENIQPPIINTSYIKETLDYKLIHRRLAHCGEDKIYNMCKNKIIQDLPTTLSRKFKDSSCKCSICWKAKLTNNINHKNLDLSNYNNGQLLHIDFMFMDIKSICHFTSILTIIDAKSRKLWLFCTQSKSPPLAVIRYFITNLQRMKIPYNT